mmetsp:Transcript_43810/g.86386  ORF Transcript_43810/g.86386 Transcript_43810/m.86386 type:complete len:213 (-) Transcript_43810:171-809(-)
MRSQTAKDVKLWLSSQAALRKEVDGLRAENSKLTSALETMAVSSGTTQQVSKQSHDEAAAALTALEREKEMSGALRAELQFLRDQTSSEMQKCHEALREAHKRAAAARWSSVRSAAGLNDGFKEVFDRDQHLPVITESSAEEAAIPGQPQTQAAVAAEAEAVASLRCEGLEKDVTELNKLLVAEQFSKKEDLAKCFDYIFELEGKLEAASSR